MSSIADFGNRTMGHPAIEHPRRPELITHWIHACTHPRGSTRGRMDWAGQRSVFESAVEENRKETV